MADKQTDRVSKKIVKHKKKTHKERREEDDAIKRAYGIVPVNSQSKAEQKRQKIEEYLKSKEKTEEEKEELVVYEKEINDIKYKIYKDGKRTKKIAQNNSYGAVMIEVIVNDRYGRKERIKCFPDDTILNLKKLIAAKTGTRYEKIKLQKGNRVFNEKISLADYEIKHGMGLEMYYA